MYALVMINDTKECIEGIEFLKRKTSAVRKAVAYLTAPFAEENDVRITYIFDPDYEGEYPSYDRFIYMGDHLHAFVTSDHVYGMTKILETMKAQLDAKACEDVTQFDVHYPVYLDDEAEAIRKE